MWYRVTPDHQPNNPWKTMDHAPEPCAWLDLLMMDHTIVAGHYAKDLSGEEQPPFIGWFTCNDGAHEYHEIPGGDPKAWRNLTLPIPKMAQKNTISYVS